MFLVLWSLETEGYSVIPGSRKRRRDGVCVCLLCVVLWLSVNCCVCGFRWAFAEKEEEA